VLHDKQYGNRTYYWIGSDRHDFWLFPALTFTSKGRFQDVEYVHENVTALKDILQE
jgi:hypothetical protein